MDEFVNRFFGSTWADDKASESLSWVGNGLDLTNGLLTDTVEPYKGDEKTMPSGLITDGLSMFVGGDSDFGLDKTLVSRDSQPLQGNTDIKSSVPSLMDGSSNSVYIDQQMRAPSTSGILKYGSPELLNVALDPANSPSAQPESGSVGSSDSETSEIQDTFRASYTVASHPQGWLPSINTSVSSLPHDTMRDKLHDFSLQGQYVQTNDAVMGYNGFTDDYLLQSDLSALLSENGQHKLNDDYLSNLTAGDHIPLGRTTNMHPQTQLSEENHIKHYADRSQISQLPYTPALGGYNGTVKPRMRARRGQATDPHSIAERLRRERIADRMKNLQELVPNSNKTDKASMLDEIIDYVKFLQLQVKVLSMSRLGAAEAVVPLITDSQTEGSGGLFLCEPAGQGVDPFEATCNEAAFEQEVVELMECNMMRAIQFLQSKGLCLMPLALAAAIPSSKASSSCISSLEGINNRYVCPKNSQPTGLVYSATETRSKEDIIGALGSGGRKRGTVKREEIMDRASNTKE